MLDQGATLDIDVLEPNFVNTDWGQVRIDKMFRDTISHLNSVTSKADITTMQKNMKKLGFYTGEVTGSYNRDFLTGYGMYQNILNNSWYNAFGALNGLQVDGAINDRWLHVANSDVDMGRKVEWAKSEDKTASWGFKSAFTAVGVADGVVSQLMKDGADTLNFIASINVASPKFYTQTIPAMFSIGKAIATGQITWDDIKDTFSESARAQFYTPFKEIAANYNKVFSGTASYAEAQEFGRNVAIALEAVSVVIGIGASAKAAQLTSKLSAAAGSVFKLATGSKAVGEGLEWITKVTKETAEKIQVSLERKFGKGTPQALKIPQGLTKEQFEKVSAMIREKVGHLSDDIVVQGSRAKGTAKPTSDIDFAIRVSPEKFDELRKDSFSKVKPPNPGSAKEKTMLHAIETGKIQSGEAKLSKFREQLQQELGMDVDISIIKIGGPFDNPPFTPIK